jgi:hypothetical protein
MQAISRRTLKAFFDWMLNQRRGKGGRRLAGIKSANTLGTYWKVFRLIHERATGKKIKGKINRKMYRVSSASCLPLNPVRITVDQRLINIYIFFQVLRKLAKKHCPTKEKREKTAMYVEDLLASHIKVVEFV